MSEGILLWSNVDRSRWFLIPDNFSPGNGSMPILTLLGDTAMVDLDSVAIYEITEDQARYWAKEQLDQSLDGIRGAIDGKLADWRRQLDEFNRTPVNEDTSITPNAASKLLDLLKQLPGVLGTSLSGDESGVGEARDTMADLQQRLKESGLDLDERFTNFPERLADLRREFEKERAEKRETKDRQPPDKS